MEPANQSAAFFDLDRTLVAGSSGIFWARAAVDAGIVSRRQMVRLLGANLQFRLRGSTDESTDAIRERLSELVVGRDATQLRRMMPEVLAGVLPRLYPQMLQIAYDHQDSGRKVYIATASSQIVAEMLSDVLGFDGGIGAVPEIVDGKMTGRDADTFPYRDGKAQRIVELAERERIDLAGSYGYSDSESDLPMLRLVGRAVAVNPDSELEAIAVEEGWEVMRFDQLGRKLQALGALALMGLVGTAGRTVAVRRSAAPPAGPRLRTPWKRR